MRTSVVLSLVILAACASAPQNAPQAQKTVPPRILSRVDPPISKNGDLVDEDIVVTATITSKGDVADPHAVGDPQLVALAVGAVGQWKFSPALDRGKPVDVPYSVTVHFHRK